MDENKDLTLHDGEVEDAAPVADAAAPETPEEPPVSAPDTEETPKEAIATEEPAKEDGATVLREIEWKSDARKAKKEKNSAGAFFAVFGVVLGICVALLVAALFLGEAGIDIVKTIETSRIIYVREDSDALAQLLSTSEVADKVSKSTVTVSVHRADGSGVGSGFAYDTQGHIVTNHHVIEGADSIQVVLPDGTAHDARVVGYHEISDLAVLEIDYKQLVPLTLGSSADLLVGEDVCAVGTPALLDLAGSASFGKVTCADRLLPVYDSASTVCRKLRVIQTDAALNPGNSGGPLVDMYGNVVGIVVRKISNYGGTSFEGISFAIPIDGAATVIDALIANGEFTGKSPVAEGPSQLGVRGYTVQMGYWYTMDQSGRVTKHEYELANAHYAHVDGVYVAGVESDAARGRLLVGDVVVRVNGLLVYTQYDLIEQVNRYAAGEKLTITVWRNGTLTEVEIALAEGKAS